MARDRPIAMPVRIIIASLGGEGSEYPILLCQTSGRSEWPLAKLRDSEAGFLRCNKVGYLASSSNGSKLRFRIYKLLC